MKYKLNHEISFWYNLVSKIIFIGSLGFLLYSAFVETLALLLCIVFSFSSFILMQMFKKYKTIEFDEKSIYFDDTKVDLKDVEEIGLGKITFKINLEKDPINFFYSPLSNNFNLLKTFHKEQV
ncbi:hypothetical protein SAMN02927916_0737 [Flavobacterium anhuiense]|uniref:PH domain-containing protein n=1 Tax=Flavobacterium anhuiense TaxID=459526 RepID=A0ABY0L9E9_9FLAO|nr:hypothetical protein [Flavobacterium anhuiense]SCX90746.1 hypothetical protein SAMN02927916_0737 [Flavobacterium anhuiense]